MNKAQTSASKESSGKPGKSGLQLFVKILAIALAAVLIATIFFAVMESIYWGKWRELWSASSHKVTPELEEIETIRINYETYKRMGILISIITAILFVFVLILYKTKKKRKEKAEEYAETTKKAAMESARKAENSLAYTIFKKCSERNFDSITTPEGKKALTVIAAAEGIHDFERAQELYLKGQELNQEYEKQKLEQQAQRYLELDQKEYGKAKENAQISGKAKYLGQDYALQASSGDGTADLKKVAMKMATYQAPKQDWAIAGGIATGLAGGAAGLATALDVQAKNAAAEANAAAIREQGLQLYKLAETTGRSHTDREEREKKLRIDGLKRHIRGALCDETDQEGKCALLQFTDWQFELKKSGYILARAKTNIQNPIDLLGSPAVLDGSVLLEVCSKNGEMLAEGYYSAPGFNELNLDIVGFKNNLKIEVVCKPEKPLSQTSFSVEKLVCNVRPFKLWLIERKPDKDR